MSGNATYCFIASREDFGGGLPHDAGIDQFAFLQRGADFFSGDENRFFVRVFFHQIDPPMES